MNLKKKIKGFFTLTRKAGGFTLVELIVVIAILAILAGVAVPAYSGYVTRANKQADITLVSEVKHALELGYYAGTLEENGKVVLIYGKAPVVDESAEEAMAAVFGSGVSKLSLKHDGWEFSGVGECTWFQNSSVNALLEEVSGLTGSVLTLLGNQMSAEKLYENMFEHMDADVLNALCAEKGIGIDTSGETPKFAEGVTNEQLSNLMVLAAAQEITNMGSENAYAYLTGESEGTNVSTMTGMVRTFAIINGFAKSDYSTADQKAAYAELEAKLASGELENTADIMDAMNACMGSFFPEEAEEGVEYPIDKYFANSLNNDMGALVEILGTVTKVAPSIGANDLKDANFYANNESISGLFTAYADAAQSEDPCILIAYVFDESGMLHILDSSAQ